MLMTLLGKVQKKAGGVVYLLRDKFTTGEAAPLTSPRTCEPGPDTFVVTDTGETLSIAGEQLQVVADSGDRNRGLVSGTSWTHQAGRALILDWQESVDIYRAVMGWGTGLANNIGGTLATNGDWDSVSLPNAGTTISYPFVPVANHGTFAIVRGENGVSYYVANNRLAWVSVETSTTAAKAWVNFPNAATAGVLLDVRVRDLAGGFTSRYGLATSRSATPAAGATAVSLGDAVIEFTWTPAADDVCELSFRRTDDNNRWLVRCDQAAGTIKLFKRAASSETEYDADKTQTWTVGTPYRLVVIADDDEIRTYVNTTNKHNLAGGATVAATPAFNLKATGVKVSHAGADLICWPRRVNLDTGAALSDAGVQVVCEGDSLTWGFGANGWVSYPRQLERLLLADAVALRAIANYGMVAHTVADLTAEVATQIDARLGQGYTQDILVVWIGANDLGAGAGVVYGRILDYCTARQLAGWTVVVCTLTPFYEWAEAERDAVNTSIRANYATFADALADLDANANIGNGCDQTNRTYWHTDNLHLNAGGYAVAAGIIKTAVEGLLA